MEIIVKLCDTSSYWSDKFIPSHLLYFFEIQTQTQNSFKMSYITKNKDLKLNNSLALISRIGLI